MADYVSSLIEITGPAEQLAEFNCLHLVGGTFDFNTVCPMPPGLDIESSSAVETGYAALYGNWQEISHFAMFKEPAQSLGFPFPLSSREQVIACLRSFECADMYLVPAKQYHKNITEHGYGDWYGWCREHWGTKWNADEVSVAITSEKIVVKFVTAGAYPKPILKSLSLMFASLEFHIRHIDERHRTGKDFVLLKGKELRKQKRIPADIAAEIAGV
jgi:hypothetical protein